MIHGYALLFGMKVDFVIVDLSAKSIKISLIPLWREVIEHTYILLVNTCYFADILVSFVAKTIEKTPP